MDAEEKQEKRYAEAVEQLRQHPPLIWARNNFFLLVQSGLLAVTMRATQAIGTQTVYLVCIAGLFIAAIWLWVIHAGQRLQRQWRDLVVRFEKDYFGGEDGAFAIAGKEIGEGSKLGVSITSALKLLASGFIVLWILFLLNVAVFGLPPAATASAAKSNSEQVGAGQPATAPEAKPEGDKNP